MGRHRKPNEIHRLEGTYNVTEHGQELRVPTLNNYPAAPTHFNKWAKAEWKRVVPRLVELGLIGEFDLGILENGIEQYGIYKECIDAIYHFYEEDERGKQKRKKRSLREYLQGRTSQTAPELTLMRSAYDKYRDAMHSFGATPVQRSKLSEQKKSEQDPMAALLSGSVEDQVEKKHDKSA